MQIETMKVKPWSADQGDYVLINAADFDAAVHVPFEEPAEPAAQDKAPARRTRKTAEPAAQE